MSDTPRFEHRILASGEHCVTSPDIRGLCAVADTEADARREADVLLALFERRGLIEQSRSGRPTREVA